MKKSFVLIVVGMIINMSIAGCASTPTPDIEATVNAAIAAALTAIPTDTPIPTPTPTETPLPPTETPTPTFTATPVPATDTPTPVPATDTPTPLPPTNTPTLSPPTSTPTPLPPTATATPSVLAAPVLIEPAEGETAYAWFDGRQLTSFRWQWDGQLPSNSTFEVRIWLDGIDPTSYGAYDVKDVAILPPAEAQKEREKREVDRAKQHLITDEGNGNYWAILNTRGARSVRPDYQTYLWTVAVVQIDPYERIGLEAPPRPISIVYINPTPTPEKD